MSAETVLQHDHRELDDLLKQVEKALFVGDGDTAFSKLDRFWARLAMHVRAEHLHLFPAIQNATEQTSETGELIEALRKDHNFFMHELAVAIKAMRSITVETESEITESVREIVRLVAERLERHNDIEESAIYPLVSRLFDSTEQGRLIGGIERELGNLPHRLRESGYKMTNCIEGFILAGGANSRMGRRKAGLRLGGRSLVEIAQSALSAITNNIRVVGEKSSDDTGDGLEWIVDFRSGEKSSLLGLTTALAHCKKPWAFVLACDMPFVTGALVERIASFYNSGINIIVPVQSDGRLQPLCALYRRDACLEKATEMLNAGNRSLHSLINCLNAKRIKFEEIADLDGSDLFFTNINTSADFEDAKNNFDKPLND